MADKIQKLGAKIASGHANIDEIAMFVSLLMPKAVEDVNEIFAPRQLIKRERTTEPLPIDKRQLSSYRTRLGTILEYAVSNSIDSLIRQVFGDELRLTFEVAHRYPDFLIRDRVLEPTVRIEMKAVDADSDEQSARFEVLSSLIQGEKDIVILIGWEWCQDELANGTKCEYSTIFSFVVVPAAELARERDESVRLRGGRVEADKILVPKKGRSGELKPDEGNAGKILRLVHTTRKKEPFKLSQYIQQYLQFTDAVTARKK
ncbi:hypothetical protein [[Phormidium] sp. ETS-05]|uniref:hypothetical protein n=1 Tax=[Phormidium] sp. ETS-05 TaxID=222819 RepID=UPI0018EED5B0|nr:hypothetical protein [[Phormidium] sp. ETS-05]